MFLLIEFFLEEKHYLSVSLFLSFSLCLYVSPSVSRVMMHNYLITGLLEKRFTADFWLAFVRLFTGERCWKEESRKGQLLPMPPSREETARRKEESKRNPRITI